MEESVAGAGQKKVGRPAPQIAIVRSTVARDPRQKTDPRQGAGTGAILSGTCSINEPRQDRNSTQSPVAEGKRTKETINRQRQD